MEQKQLNEQDAKRFRRFIKANYWQFAKTYASFCPHEYALKRNDRTGDFKWFCETVIANGFDARFGKNTAKYFIDYETGYYYFVPYGDIDENGKLMPHAMLINRSHVNEFEFVEEITMFGTDVIVKRLPPDRRKPW